MKQLIYTTAMLALFSTATLGQSLFGVSYDIGLPLGTTADYIGNPSFRGFGLEARSFVSDNLSVGGSFNWAVFYEEVGPQEFSKEIEGTGTAYGKQYRYINSFPIMANMHYYLGEWDETRLYVGGGLGVQKVDQRTDFGLYTINNNKWRFGFSPEVGVLIPMNFNTSLNLSAKYQYALKAGDAEAVSYLNFKIGFAFM
jgi:opacity protein-like surface antigen